MLFTAGSKILFIGDSITDCGRKPGGEGLFDALGKGYVARVDALLQATYPELKLRVVNMGTGGNTVRDLKKRWVTDVMEQKPDFVSVMIGINDVWRQFDTPFQKDWGVGIKEYGDTLEELLVKTKRAVKGLVLMAPFYIEPNRKDAMRARMDEYREVVRKLAGKHGAVFVDTQFAFKKILKVQHSSALAWDRVHPNETGHMLIAKAFLKGVGFKW